MIPANGFFCLGRRLVIERVGQPVAKVVNPLGTVITVSADEEDISFSQDCDLNEETTPEPPRSVCAEEGPTSLTDFVSEGQILRSHTEICAEMRTANEPIIDSVPDENIKEVKEKKTLCAEVAELGKSSIFEREESFRDVPTSLSLCAQQGEIPDSPMTQARDNAWKSKCDDQERKFAKAKYVVNYDDDSVVLMENKSARRKAQKNKATNKGVKIVEKNLETREPKYLLKENEDSIVVEDLTQNKLKLKEETIIERVKEDFEPIDIEKESLDSKTLDTGDDLASMEYHMVEMASQQSDDDLEHIAENLEKNPPVQRKSSKSTISDDDLEHIHSTELEEAQKSEEIPPLEDKFHQTEKPQIPHEEEKLLKNILSSDDDLEHVLHSELDPLPNDSSIQSSKTKDIIETQTTAISSDQDQEKLNETPLIEDKKEIEIIDIDTIEKEEKKKKSQQEKLKPEIEDEKKVKKPSSAKRQSEVEIIDIDAMHKAEMKEPFVPELKILEGGTKKKKRGKKNSEDAKLPQKSQITWNSSKQKEGTSSPDPWSLVLKKTKSEEREIQEAKPIECDQLHDIKKQELEVIENLASENMFNSPKHDVCQTLKEITTLKNNKLEENDLLEKDVKLETLKLLEKENINLENDENLEKTSTIDRSNGDTKAVIEKINCQMEKSNKELVEINVPNETEKRNDSDPEKRSDSEPENLKENSSSSDDPNANVIPMDTEEDVAVKEMANRGGGGGTTDPEVATVTKKFGRSKKKRRR